MRGLIGLLAVVLALGASSAVLARQSPSLADVARREAERRKTLKAPGKVYTNVDVKKNTPPPPPPAAKPAEGEPAKSEPVSATQGSAGGESPQVAPTPKPVPAEPPKDEAWYRKTMADLQDQLNRHQLFAEALQSRINALWADFTARDDPAQRAVIEKNRIQALAELERVKRDTIKLEQMIADFEEEARKAGVPPGWLR